MIHPSEITKETQIYDWFLHELTPVEDGPVYEFQGRKWQQLYGYHYAVHTIGFFRCEDGRWALDVNEFPYDTFNPTMGIYSSYDNMLMSITKHYAWKIRSAS